MRLSKTPEAIVVALFGAKPGATNCLVRDDLLRSPLPCAQNIGGAGCDAIASWALALARNGTCTLSLPTPRPRRRRAARCAALCKVVLAQLHLRTPGRRTTPTPRLHPRYPMRSRHS